jgi:hypothetical protein
MKRFLIILAGLLIFAVGLGIGREQAKEVAYKQGYAEGWKRGEQSGKLAGYLGGINDEMGCTTLRQPDACERRGKLGQ